MNAKRHAVVLEKVEAGDVSATYGEFDACFSRDALNAMSAYIGSLDAAKALHNAVLAEWGWYLNRLSCKLVHADYSPVYGQRTTTPARAWLIVIIKALIAQEGE